MVLIDRALVQEIADLLAAAQALTGDAHWQSRAAVVIAQLDTLAQADDTLAESMREFLVDDDDDAGRDD